MGKFLRKEKPFSVFYIEKHTKRKIEKHYKLVKTASKKTPRATTLVKEIVIFL